MNIPSIRRPNPQSGEEAGREYADAYMAGHTAENDTPGYRLGYAAHLLLDNLLPTGYSLLDVGCGTGGYHRLLQNYGQIVGLDFSTEMVVAANELKARYKLDRVTYCAERFERYQPEQKFDCVSLIGTFGWYVPWKGNDDIFARTATMLNNDGLVCFSYVDPRNLWSLLKTVFLPSRTVITRRTRMGKMLQGAGFSKLLELNYSHVNVVFAKISGDAATKTSRE